MRKTDIGDMVGVLGAIPRSHIKKKKNTDNSEYVSSSDTGDTEVELGWDLSVITGSPSAGGGCTYYTSVISSLMGRTQAFESDISHPADNENRRDWAFPISQLLHRHYLIESPNILGRKVQLLTSSSHIRKVGIREVKSLTFSRLPSWSVAGLAWLKSSPIWIWVHKPYVLCSYWSFEWVWSG